MLRLTVIGLSLFVWHLCQAQGNDWHFHHLNVQNGLSEATNYYVLKDSRGFVWLSSISGLNRFDGRQVRVYQPELADSTSLFGQNIQSPFFEDAQSNIWFSTYEGINCYIRKTDNFKHFSLKDSLNNLILGYYVGYLDTEDNLWLLVEEQTVYLFNIRTHYFKRLHDVRKGMQRLVVQSSPYDVKRSYTYSWNTGRDGLQITNYLPNGQFSQQILYDKASSSPISINEVLVESDTMLWLTTHRKGLLSFNPITLTTQTTPLNNKAHTLSQWLKKFLIIGTEQNGIQIFDKNQRTLIQNFRHNATMPNSLGSDYIDNIYQDADGGVWAYLYGKGTDFTVPAKSKFSRRLHSPTDSTLSKPMSVTAITADAQGNVWCGSNGSGLQILAPTSKIKQDILAKSVISRNSISSWTYQIFKDRQHRLWLMHWSSISLLNTAKSQLKKIADAEHYFLYGLETHDGKILLASLDHGVFEAIEKSNGSFIFEKITTIPQSYTILAEDNAGLLWCSNTLVVHVFDPHNNYQLIRELPLSGSVTGFYFPKNKPTVWIASNNGLVEIDKSNNWQSTVYIEKNGLPSRTINAMLGDKNGNLWLGTSKGLAQFNPASKTAKTYNLTDGISDLTFNMYAATQTADGTMYFGTSNGITVFHPDKITPLSISARPTITGILINDQIAKKLICRNTGATNVSEIQRLVLPYSENTLSFNFSAMEYSDPLSCTFQYKMVGTDNEWVNAGTLPFARYANLQAGDYSFLIKAANSDGVWNETPRTLLITIIPPFWRTWWFITLSFAGLMALVGYIVFLRLSKVIALQKIRLSLYENLHDDIGSRLTAIVLTVDEMVQKASIKDSKLERIGSISRNIVANMRRLVWATAPENDALSTVVQQMQTDRRVLLPSGVDFKLKMDKNLENVSIGGDKRYQMLSIFNESLTNIAKYAEATNVETRMEILDDKLIMTIKDNGKGFDPNAPRENSAMSSGHGLRNMHRRAHRIKGNLDISSTLGKGTTIKLSFPMKEDAFWKKIPTLFFPISPK